MTELPRLELTENSGEKNDYIIFRHSFNNKRQTKKHIHRKKNRTKNKRRVKKSIFNIFN